MVKKDPSLTQKLRKERGFSGMQDRAASLAYHKKMSKITRKGRHAYPESIKAVAALESK